MDKIIKHQGFPSVQGEISKLPDVDARWQGPLLVNIEGGIITDSNGYHIARFGFDIAKDDDRAEEFEIEMINGKLVINI